MTLNEFLVMVRKRWVAICALTALGFGGAIAVNQLVVPQYQATTRLFVATPMGYDSAYEIFQAGASAERRVISYARLLSGETLAQRVIDKLNLGITAKNMQSRITAKAPPNTVLLELSVRDSSATRARDIANALSEEFTTMVAELEKPPGSRNPRVAVTIQQPSALPDRPVTPNKLRNVLLGTLAGLGLGIGLAYLREILDNTVHTRQRLEHITDAALLASIPIDPERRDHAAIDFPGDTSYIAEEFRSLRTNLRFCDVDNPPRVFVVTSALPAEGKTTTSINLALALAEAGHEVLLVDADMRRPRVHEYLNLVGSVGLSSVLADDVSPDDAVQRTEFPNLSVMAAGPLPPNPSELLGSAATQKLLSRLRGSFDYIVLDSSPLLAVSDTAALAVSADGVLMLARFAKTKRNDLAHAVDKLAKSGARVLGSVFSMVPHKAFGYYGYYGYYGYGRGESGAGRHESAAA